MIDFSWADGWFRRVFPPLLGMQVFVIVAWLVAAHATAGGASITRQAPTLATALAAAPVRTSSLVASNSTRHMVNESRNTVGPVRLGMTLAAAQQAVGEQLVEVQRQDSPAHRFESVAPGIGLTLEGAHGRIDSITVTNVGEGPSFATGRGLHIGDSELRIAQKYPYARLVCGHSWWIDRGSNTMRITIQKRIASIMLTSQKRPAFVECY